jgi:hypothetical protein
MDGPSTFQRRRDGRQLYEPTEAEDRYYSQCDEALERHFAEVDAYEAMLDHLAAFRAGEVELRVGMHGADCLRKGGADCICTGREATVLVEDPADRLDDGRACGGSWWSEAPR